MKKTIKILLCITLFISCVSEEKSDLTTDLIGKWRLYVVYYTNTLGNNEQINYTEMDNIIFHFVDDKKLFINKNSLILEAREYNYSFEYDYFITYTYESGNREKLMNLNNSKYAISTNRTTGDKEFKDFNNNGYTFYLQRIE